MVLQGLSPGVQHGDRADLCAEMLGVGGDVAHRFGRGAEQDGVDRALVLERDLGRRRRQGEDDMVVGHRQQLGLTRLEPLGACQTLALRAMSVAAGVVGAANQPAVAALLDVPSQRRRPADLDRRHDASLDPAEMSRMAATERVAVAAEDIRHLQRRTHRRRLRAAASPQGAAGRVGSACRGWCWSRPARSAPWCSRLRWPSSAWMMRMSVPPSSRWVAKLCRSVCTVTRLPRPDAAHAERQAACSTVASIGCSGSRPGNSQCVGRASRQYERRMPSSCGDSMT